MTNIACLEQNPFAENTCIVWDETKDCAIFDPGCYTHAERMALKNFIETRDLNPTWLINTHCHLDHVFGNRFVAETWGLKLAIHRGELPVLEQFPQVCRMYGIPNIQESPMPEIFLEAGEEILVGNSRLKILFTPGHSPASISFYCAEGGFVVAGDVLFFESIGRTDLPGGDLETLLASIRTQLFTLPDETLVYPGHGPSTSIRHEREYNPFLQ